MTKKSCQHHLEECTSKGTILENMMIKLKKSEKNERTATKRLKDVKELKSLENKPNVSPHSVKIVKTNHQCILTASINLLIKNYLTNLFTFVCNRIII